MKMLFEWRKRARVAEKKNAMYEKALTKSEKTRHEMFEDLMLLRHENEMLKIDKSGK